MPAFTASYAAESLNLRGVEFPRRRSISTEPHDIKPRTMGFLDAQEWVNFVILKPTWLPADCRLAATELRVESPPRHERDLAAPGRSPWTLANPSAYRFEIAGENRRLRVKQFLYDWAPPATSHPSLWGSRPAPFALHESPAIGWIGKDYKNNRAASVRLHRTMVELSILEGNFSDQEIRAIFNNLLAASRSYLENISRLPFAKLSYWARYHPPLIVLPYGLFRYREPRPELPVNWSCDASDLAALPYLPPLPPETTGYRFDSVGVHGSREAPEAVELVFSRGSDRADHLWFIAEPLSSAARLSTPPLIDEHPCTCEEVRKAGSAYWHAFVTEEFGPHDAIATKNDVIFLLTCSSAPDTNGSWFRDLIRQLLGA